MANEVGGGAERVRAADLIGALCLATDLGMGFPFEHGLRTTVFAMRLADWLGVDPETASQIYYAAMLSHVGCTTDSAEIAEVFGGSLTEHLNPVVNGSLPGVIGGLLRALPDPSAPSPLRAVQTAVRLPRMARTLRPHLSAGCEVAQMLAGGVGLPPSVAGLLAFLTDRWDGKGPLRRGTGEEIPFPMRVVAVAVDAAFLSLSEDTTSVAGLIRDRAGRAFDPDVALAMADGAEEILAPVSGSVWEEMIELEPSPQRWIEGEAIDRALAAMGNFADLISPYFAGHAAGVAELTQAAAVRCRLDDADVAIVCRAARIHDLGRVAIGVPIWHRSGAFTADDREQVRLHPYHTERCLSRSEHLASLAPIAAAHHERLDGSGYHKGLSGADQPFAARLLAAADAFQAMCEPRPHRDALGRERAAETLAAEASSGRFDPDAVTAVIEAAGQTAPRIERPAGLTEREAQVVAMVARGLQTKQVARQLGISVKTADRHVQNAYRKAGVSTRAAATLFAMEHGLVAWGELPMSGRNPRS